MRRAKPCESIKKNRCGGLASGEAEHGPIIGAAEPNRDRVSFVETDRERITVAVGGPGFIGDAPKRRVERRRCAAQNIGNIPAGDGPGDPACLLAGVPASAMVSVSSGTLPFRAMPA